jgi:hypothetical protein
MNYRTTTQERQQSQTSTPLTSGVLQRKCACGTHTVAGGECAECAKKKSGLQRKLTIGASNDPLEREADQIADQVMAASAPSLVSGAPPRIQRYAGQATEGRDSAPASVERVLANSGRPLNPALQQEMEQRFGCDFSRVRVHSGGAAEQSAQDVNANAYTVGHNIVFGAGQFAPGTPEGRRLIAHELTHVVQQSGADGIRVGQTNEKRSLSPITLSSVPDAPSIAGVRPRLEAGSSLRIWRQQKSGSKPAVEPEDESVEDIPAEDKWKGTLVSEIVISLARSRVGFRIPQGMLLGTVKTDLAVGTYELKPVPAKQKWIIEGPGVEAGTRFSVDLTESSADPWTLSYPDKLTLTVGAGALGEPKTFRDMTDEGGELKDPLWVYEGWGGNTSPSMPVAGIDDYETIELVKETVTPPDEKGKATTPRYKVKYRDKTERLLTYVELTQKMRAQLRPMFEKADEDFLLFTIETFPMWWSIVSITPLAPMPASGARPYIPKRVPLAPAEPPVTAPAGKSPAAPRIPLQRPAAGRPPESPQSAPAAAAAQESVVVSLALKAKGPGVAFGQQAAARLAAQGKTGPAILRPLAQELNAQPSMSPMDKAAAVQAACNAQKVFGAGPIAQMPDGNLVVTSRAPLPKAPVVIVQPDGSVVFGKADLTLINNNSAFKVSNVTVTP